MESLDLFRVNNYLTNFIVGLKFLVGGTSCRKYDYVDMFGVNTLDSKGLLEQVVFGMERLNHCLSLLQYKL